VNASRRKLIDALDLEYPLPDPSLKTWAHSESSISLKERQVAGQERRRELLAAAVFAIVLVAVAAFVVLRSIPRHAPAPAQQTTANQNQTAKSAYVQRVDADWTALTTTWHGAGPDCRGASTTSNALPKDVAACKQALLRIRASAVQMEADLAGAVVPPQQAQNDEELKSALSSLGSTIDSFIVDIDSGDAAAQVFGPQAQMQSQNMIPVQAPYLQTKKAVTSIDRAGG
jgi:hypothetical protein